MENNKLKVGIAGFGIVGKRRFKFINEHPKLKVVAMCDQKFSGSSELIDGARCYSNYEMLLEKEKLDVLFVCLPNDVAPEITIAGLEGEMHVFCEKPPGRNVADIKKVIECEQHHPNLKLKYGFNHRYHDSVRDALRIIRSKELGKIINMRGVYGKSAVIPWPRPSAPNLHLSGERFWRTERAIAGGGILLDQGIHLVDIMRLFAGDFPHVKSYVSNSFWKHSVEDNAYALMQTDNGIVAMLHSTATQWRHRFSLDISLTNGGLILSGILSGTKSYGQETLTIVYRKESDNGNPREQTTSYIEDNSWKDEIFEFADAIINDKKIEDGNSQDALKSMQLVYRIYCADESWRDEFDLSCQ